MRRRIWLILAFVLLSVAVTYWFSSIIAPAYEATATIDIDAGILSGLTGSPARQVSMLDVEQLMATQLELIQSDRVLRPVVEQYNLLHLEKQDADASNISQSEAKLNDAPISLRELRLYRKPNTSLIKLRYRSPEAKLSAAIANAIARSYIQRTSEVQSQKVQALSRAMESQMVQLKTDMERSRDRLAAFEGGPHFVDPEEKQAVLASALVQLNNDRTTAEGLRLRKEAVLGAIKGGAFEASEITTQAEAIRQVAAHLRESEERFELVKNDYGKNHPAYKKAAAEVIKFQSDLEKARAGLEHTAELELQQAKSRETTAGRAVAQSKKEFEVESARAFEYRTLKREAEAAKKLYDEAGLKIKETAINASVQNDSVRLVDPARPPLRPISPDLRVNLLLALCISPCAAFLCVVAWDRRNLTIQNPQIAWSRDLNLPVLGNLPLLHETKAILPAIDGTSRQARRPGPVARFLYEEAIQSLHSTIMLSPELRGLRSVAITSALPGEGKTVTACQLAMANARRHRKTLLVDCDFRRPAVHQRCGIHPVRGMEAVLDGTARWKDVICRMAGLTDIEVLPVGMNGVRALDFLRTRLPVVMAELTAAYDLVVIDAPPMLGLSDTLEIAAAADGVLLIAIPGESQSQALGRCVSLLRQVGVRNLGLVMNKISQNNSAYTYHENYGKYYGRYLGAKSS